MPKPHRFTFREMAAAPREVIRLGKQPGGLARLALSDDPVVQLGIDWLHTNLSRRALGPRRFIFPILMFHLPSKEKHLELCCYWRGKMDEKRTYPCVVGRRDALRLDEVDGHVELQQKQAERDYWSTRDFDCNLTWDADGDGGEKMKLRVVHARMKSKAVAYLPLLEKIYKEACRHVKEAFDDPEVRKAVLADYERRAQLVEWLPGRRGDSAEGSA